MISFEHALQEVISLAQPLGHEQLPFSQAAGRILAKPVLARIDSPRADVSTMDGYAVRDRDLSGKAGRGEFIVLGQSFPGIPFDANVDAGMCVQTFTGAPLPRGADRIIVQELIQRTGQRAEVTAPPGEARWIRRRGSDFRTGDVLLEKGRQLNVLELVAAAAGDVATVDVFRRPRIAIIGTGSELVPPGSASAHPFSVPDSVSTALALQLEAVGGTVIHTQLLGDDLPALKQAARALESTADLIVVTGGASVGERDFAKAMFADRGLVLKFSKVTMKPGKPVWLGQAGRQLIMGLPGNPSSALVTSRLLLVPLVAGLAGRDAHAAIRWRSLPSASSLPAGSDRETFWRAALRDQQAVPLSNQDSGAQGALASADLLIRRPAGAAEIAAGEMVSTIRF